ncbi:pyroglutamylated rfamide peptide receptor-like protein [Lasius niger]|uniref:Pyroglutamylated rfamide peptide receptor-like protein n=1 Tax=Lasius niger TaxID=67767 RepID=A0A0J7L1M3_LASNI|nr:pyroglutamylated rfamide peptide receptor-like protein [Lasius niger]
MLCQQVVKMLVAVVVLFAICWGPMLIDNVLTAYGYLPRIKGGTHKHLNTVFQLMAYFNRYVQTKGLYRRSNVGESLI